MNTQRRSTARLVIILILGGLLALPGGIANAGSGSATVNPASADARSDPSTATHERPARVPAKKVRRAYGDGPVRVDRRRQTVVIEFTGRRGDIVHLDTGRSAWLEGSATRLLRKGTKLAATWKYYWQLPRDGAYTFRFRPSSHDRAGRRLQLVKLRVREAALDSTVAGRKLERGYQNAIALDLSDGQRATVSGDYTKRVLTPDGGSAVQYGEELQLEPGAVIGTRAGDNASQLGVLDPGRVLVLSRQIGVTRVTASVVQPVVVDGGTVAVTPDRVREYVFSFPQPDSQYAVARLQGAEGTYLRVSDPLGRRHVPVAGTQVIPTASTPGPDGSYRLSLTSTEAMIGREFRLSVDSVTELTGLVPGQPTTFTVTEPGHFVVAAVARGTYRFVREISASDAAFIGPSGAVAWRAVLSSGSPFLCPGPYGPLGCGESDYAETDATRAVDQMAYGTGSVVVLEVPEGATGQVSIRVDPDS